LRLLPLFCFSLSREVKSGWELIIMRKRSSELSASFFIIATAALLASLLALSTPAFGQSPPSQQPPAQPQKLQEPAQQADDKPLKINTALVTVPVTVTNSYGGFVTGLRQRDFSVREDGVPQKIENFFSTEEPFNAALTFVKQLQPNDRVMIVSFDEKVQFRSDFTSDHRTLEQAIHKLESSYATSLYDAIYRTVTEKLIPLRGRKAIVVLTDGVDTASKQATFESVLELVASNGIASYAIQYETRNDGGPLMRPLFFPGQNFMPGSSGSTGHSQRTAQPEPAAFVEPQEPQQSELQKSKPIINIPRPSGPGQIPSTTEPAPTQKKRSGDQVIYLNQSVKRDPYLIAADFLRALAIQSGALHLRAESIENTSYAFARIADELRHQYTLTYVSSNENRDGSYRMISVSVNGPERNLIVRTRQGYRAPKGDGQ